jgi:hypothetical protein
MIYFYFFALFKTVEELLFGLIDTFTHINSLFFQHPPRGFCRNFIQSVNHTQIHFSLLFCASSERVPFI